MTTQGDCNADSSQGGKQKIDSQYELHQITWRLKQGLEDLILTLTKSEESVHPNPWS